jgi:hypothetical protein
MKENRSWGEVIAEVEHSGERSQQKQKVEARERYIFLRQ